MFACLLIYSSLQTMEQTFEAAMGDLEQGNVTDEVFTDPDLEIFTLNDLFNVITYTVMSLGVFCQFSVIFYHFDIFSWDGLEHLGPHHGRQEGQHGGGQVWHLFFFSSFSSQKLLGFMN